MDPHREAALYQKERRASTCADTTFEADATHLTGALTVKARHSTSGRFPKHFGREVEDVRCFHCIFHFS